jgi:uncharacterized protein YjbI with pentapeptide repeats
MAGKVKSAQELVRRYAEGERDFVLAQLTGAELVGAQLCEADLSGAKLAGARLCKADLSGARLNGGHLREADLSQANLSGAQLREVDLSGARLSQADLGGAKLLRAMLMQADLSEARLVRAFLIRAGLGEANLSGAQLREADLSGADLSGARLSEAGLREADLGEANLSGAQLREADLSGAHLSNADLRRARLLRALLVHADLRGAKLLWACLIHADLSGANLSGANLYAADLSGANLSRANLSGAKLREVDLSGADIRFARLKDADLNRATFDGCVLEPGCDLLGAQWESITIDGCAYQRDAVRRGEQLLPHGSRKQLQLVIETVRLAGKLHEAATAVADYVAASASGVSAEVIAQGGAGTIIRFGVAEHEDANILLQVRDGFCRLIGMGSGESARPAGTSMTSDDLEQRFASYAQRAGYRYQELKEALEQVRDAAQKVVLRGFERSQIGALRTAVERGSGLLEIKLVDDCVEAQRVRSAAAGTLAGVAPETAVWRPIQPLLEGLLRPV